jgi:2-oxoglutarate ferredoxin oxidoreductase subunit beta
MPTATPLTSLTTADLATDQEVRWCPGCGDLSILAQLKKALAESGIPREKLVFVSGAGCASRFPYYLNTYGFHTIRGRAPTIATGLKLLRPDLSVWVVTGDGDALSVGGNHLLHALRRNVDIKILLINNEIGGLLKGQASPTSRPGTRTRTTPDGSFENPMRPLSIALAADATFVARTVDVDIDHLTDTLKRAAAHKGSAFVEIYQNCKVFNDGVFEYASDKATKGDHLLYLEHGQPLIFGNDQTRGLRLNGLDPELVTLGNGIDADRLPIHDEAAPRPMLAYLLSLLAHPEFPESVGVFRCVTRPTHDELVERQLAETISRRGRGTLDELFEADDVWEVK